MGVGMSFAYSLAPDVFLVYRRACSCDVGFSVTCAQVIGRRDFLLLVRPHALLVNATRSRIPLPREILH